MTRRGDNASCYGGPQLPMRTVPMRTVMGGANSSGSVIALFAVDEAMRPSHFQILQHWVKSVASVAHDQCLVGPGASRGSCPITASADAAGL